MIKFSCENCAQKISVPEIHAGKKGRCPKCGEIVVVPAKSAILEFHCKKCGQKIRVPEIHAGKNGKCPKCKNIVTIPNIQSAGSVAIRAESISEEITPKAFGLDPRLFDLPQAMKAENQPYGQQPVSDTTLEDVQRLRQMMTIGSITQEPPPQRQLPWFIDILLYPTNKAGLIMIGIIIGIPILFKMVSVLMVFLTLICPLLLILWPIIGLLGFIIAVLFGMYLYWYLCECIRDSAEGCIRAPETIGQTPGLWELFVQSWKTFVCLVLFAAPALLYFTYTHRTDAIFWALTAFGIFFFPMGLLAVIMFDTFTSLNPVIIIGSIFSTFLPYLGLILLLATSVLSVRLLMFVSNLVFSLGGIYTTIVWLIIYGSGIIDFYMMMVIAHLLGRFFYKYQEKLNWEV
jgi:DNA-directed RNA polymerase subunit RPC12/RpoP